jgi:hypothetical protein
VGPGAPSRPRRRRSCLRMDVEGMGGNPICARPAGVEAEGSGVSDGPVTVLHVPHGCHSD